MTTTNIMMKTFDNFVLEDISLCLNIYYYFISWSIPVSSFGSHSYSQEKSQLTLIVRTTTTLQQR